MAGFVTLDVGLIASCDDNTGVTAIGTISSGPSDSDFVQQQGSDNREWLMANGTSGGLRGTIAAGGTFNARLRDASLWFLNPVTNDAGAQLLNTAANGVTVRLYSNQSGADRWAQFNQGGRNDIPGGWNLLRVNAGQTPDLTSGTWTTADQEACNGMAVYLNNVSAANTGKNDGGYGLDWIKHHSKIIVAGDDAGQPWTFARIAEISRTITEPAGDASEGNWGLVIDNDPFFELRAGLEVIRGGAPATDGNLQEENKYIFLNMLAASGLYNLEFDDQALVRLGLLDSDGPSGNIYAVNGCIIRPSLGRPTITVRNKTGTADQFILAGSRVQGMGAINLGDGGNGGVILNNNDLFDNNVVDFRSAGIDVENIRIHYPLGSEKRAGGVYVVPT